MNEGRENQEGKKRTESVERKSEMKILKKKSFEDGQERALSGKALSGHGAIRDRRRGSPREEVWRANKNTGCCPNCLRGKTGSELKETYVKDPKESLKAVVVFPEGNIASGIPIRLGTNIRAKTIIELGWMDWNGSLMAVSFPLEVKEAKIFDGRGLGKSFFLMDYEGQAFIVLVVLRKNQEEPAYEGRLVIEGGLLISESFSDIDGLPLTKLILLKPKGRIFFENVAYGTTKAGSFGLLDEEEPRKKRNPTRLGREMSKK